MYNKFVLISLSFMMFVSCAVHKTRNQVYKSSIEFKGGVAQDKSWEESLVFQKHSWFYDATISYEILLAKLTKDSAFANWMGKDRLYLTSCAEFYIVALYADINARHGVSLLISELTKSGYTEVRILDFSHQIKSHQNYKDWKLGRHKIVGLCSKNKIKNDIFINIPGHKLHKVL